ncbi:EcsC family protein [Nocardioides gansuensis]|uniref:EcsC family protein n=1 Tax=Nocardioides gansuensis TaxID=2138300 RepID=UPI001BABE1CE|nr:EcsC family protein [Nocardioides gansuensis]
MKDTRSALEAAADPTVLGGDGRLDQAMSKLVTMLLDLGLDGKGPIDSATQVAEEALLKAGSPEAAVHRVARGAMTRGAIGGFVTGVGGFVTMPVALPANVLEFYVQATRMVGAIATLRGYDVDDPQIRTAVLLTLVGSRSDEVLRKAGMATGGSRLVTIALRNVPPAALMVINKAVGFNLMKGVGTKALGKLGRGVPLVGGVIGGGVDGFMMKKIADHAMQEFPRRVTAPGA